MMGSSPLLQKDYDKHYGTYAEYKSENDKLGVESLDNETWINKNYSNMPTGKNTKKGYNPKKIHWKVDRVSERKKTDPKFAESLDTPLPDDFTEYLNRRGVKLDDEK